MTSARTQGGEPGNRVTVLICIHLPSTGISSTRSLRHQEECEYCTSSIIDRGTGRERCEESASVIGGTGRRSETSAQPGSPREPGVREVVGDYRSGKREHLRFLPGFLKTTVKEHDFAKMIAEIEATSWRLRETIRVRELAATNRLGKNASFADAREDKTWKREFGFDRVETAAEMDEQRSRTRTSPVPDPFYYRNMVIPRHPHTPDFTHEMKGDAEVLRMEIILSQPASPQCDPLSRRAAVDTGSEESGTLPRSPAIGTGSDGPGVSRFETSTEKEGLFSLKTSMGGFFNFTGTEQECILSKSDVGVDDNDDSTSSKVQAGAREEFARSPIGRQ